MSVATFAAGRYRYIEGMFQYSGGVAAEPGAEIVRARLTRPLPLAEGFRVAALESAPDRSRAARFLEGGWNGDQARGSLGHSSRDGPVVRGVALAIYLRRFGGEGDHGAGCRS